MKIYKLFMSFMICICLILKPFPVYANSGTLDGFTLDGTYTDGNGREFQAYTYNGGEDGALPNGFKYYYKYNNGKVITMERGDVIANILNRKVGVVMEPQRLATFIADYGSAIVGRNPEYYSTMTPVLKQGGLVGVALNGLTGGTLDSDNANTNITIPSSECNNVYNFYIYWKELPANKEYPEYINIHGCTEQQAISYCSQDIENRTKCIRDFGAPYISASRYDRINAKCNFTTLYKAQEGCFYTLDGFNTFCNDVGLDMQNRDLSWGELCSATYSQTYIRQKKRDDFTNVSTWPAMSYGSPPTSTTSNNVYQTWFGGTSSNNVLVCGDITIWQSTTVVNQIQNNVYSAPSYNTNSYQNYNTGNNNSYTTSSNEINNSTTDNSQIYTEANTSNNTNISNQIDNSDNSYSSVDNSSVVTNTTTIVNTYITNNYGSDTPDPDTPSGGGGGGNSGGNNSDLEDDGILSALLAAILRLLRAIGQIIATILTGIIDIITSVLAAIANITTSFTGIISFIGSVFGFLPSDALSVLTLGLTLSVLIALIKMFGK